MPGHPEIHFWKNEKPGHQWCEVPAIIYFNVSATLDYFITYSLKSDLSTVIVPTSIAAFCAAVT